MSWTYITTVGKPKVVFSNLYQFVIFSMRQGACLIRFQRQEPMPMRDGSLVLQQLSGYSPTCDATRLESVLAPSPLTGGGKSNLHNFIPCNFIISEYLFQRFSVGRIPPAKTLRKILPVPCLDPHRPSLLRQTCPSGFNLFFRDQGLIMN